MKFVASNQSYFFTYFVKLTGINRVLKCIDIAGNLVEEWKLSKSVHSGLSNGVKRVMCCFGTLYLSRNKIHFFR